MSLFKVHVIEANIAVGMKDAVAKRDDLGRSIAKLAERVNTPVFFHDFKDPVAGAPKILLECSDTFLELVKKLPGFARTQELVSDLETERKPSIQKYFSSLPATPLPPKTGGIKPAPPRR